MKAEAIDPERKREVMRQRMLAAAATAAAAGQTKEQMFQTISSMAAGDPVLLKEARSIAQAQGRMAQAGTIPGYVEDIGSLFKFG
jgi:nitrous oxide reductase